MNILPLCCFPSAYWLHLVSSDALVDVHENYVKQSYRNRFDIAGVNGKITLTIPVEGQKGQKIPFCEIRITQGPWQKQHLRSIRAAYGRSPYFEHFFPDLETLFLKPPSTLSEFNFQALEWIRSSGLHFSFEKSESYCTKNQDDIDYRAHFEPAYPRPDLPVYPQVFSDRQPFLNDLSSVDLMMNLGTGLKDYLRSIHLPG